MKVKLMKVLSSSIEPNTITIIISTTFMYSLNLWTKRVEDYIFNHIWIIGFTSLESCIIPSTLWFMVSLKWEAWTSSCLESRSLRTINLLFNLLLTHNANLIRLKWGKKLPAIVSSHIKYCEYTMPRAAMTFTLGNLWNNSKHKFDATFEHAALTISSMAIWSTKMHINTNISKTFMMMETILLANNVEC